MSSVSKVTNTPIKRPESKPRKLTIESSDSSEVNPRIKRFRRSKGVRRLREMSGDTPMNELAESKASSDSSKRSKRRKSRKRWSKESSLDKVGSDSELARSCSRICSYSRSKNEYGDIPEKSRRKSSSNFCGDDELPITNVLKEAPESPRTTYIGEAVSIRDLTTDTIYVQGRNGFSAVKIGQSSKTSTSSPLNLPNDILNSQPIKAAVLVQKIWKCAGLTCQGFLGGMSLMHFIMFQNLFEMSLEFLPSYSIFSEIYSNGFSFLVVMCLISTFDNFDLAHMDLDHLREIYTDHSKSVLSIPLYIMAFVLHQVTLKVDNKLASISYNETLQDNTTDQVITNGEFKSWQWMTICKDISAVLAWLFVSLNSQLDLFLLQLQSMEKYADNVSSSR
ncbi:uncharacterized protein LOC105702770 [Orussus abietinus]|uniref:uncharacterized protein LOC105702770 n=1 Tax=Orussus abietinus TaxID=222816 RepID=UPI000626DF61|nr:uncharacterized protein LOC105702770 [Orussus abietinus]